MESSVLVSPQSEHFYQRLQETIAWCTYKLSTVQNTQAWQSYWNPGSGAFSIPAEPSMILRSPEMEPLRSLHHSDYSRLRKESSRRDEQERVAIQKQIDNDRRFIVENLGNKRAELLSTLGGSSVQPTDAQSNGRLLGYAPEETLMDGASGSATEYYLDEADIPPWDTWIDFIITDQRGMLIAWVPPVMIPLVDEGLLVNAVDCIFWLEMPAAQGVTRPDRLP